MPGNLLGMVHRHIDQATIDTMANLLGQSRQTMQSAMEQVAPVLVGGLAQKASTRAGADELSASLDRVDVRILDDVQGYLASNTSHVTQSGTGILGGIFGADLGNVIGRLAPSTGLGDAGTSSVMKMLAPIVLAVLARHQRHERLDSRGLAQFLDDQRRDVNAALPASMTGLFGMSEGRSGELGEQIGESRDRADRFGPGGAGGVPTGAAADPKTGQGGRPAGEAQGMHPRHGGGGPSAMYNQQLGPEHGGPRRPAERSAGLRWMVPLLGVLAIIALAYGLLRHREVDGVETFDPAVHGVQEQPSDEEREGTAPEEQQRYQPGYGPDMEGPERQQEPTAPRPGDTSPGQQPPEQQAPNPQAPNPQAPGQQPPEGQPQQQPPQGQPPLEQQPGAPQGPQGAVDPGTSGAVGAVQGVAPAGATQGADTQGADTQGADTQGTETQGTDTQGAEEPLYLGTLFGAGSSQLSTDPGNRLNSLLQLVQNNPDQAIEVRGYAFGADSAETEQLAAERAEAVRQWLVDNGVDPARIEASSGGTSSRSQIDVFLR